MQYTAKDIIKECNDRNIHLYHLAIEDEMNKNNVSEEYIRTEFYKMLDVMGKSSSNFLEKESVTNMGMIDGFAKKMNDYYKKGKSFCGDDVTRAMAMAFSTIEVNASMGKIVAAPTAGASGILPAAFMSAKIKFDLDKDTLINGLLTSSFVGKIIGKYFTFAGAEGGCQAECGSAASMASAGLVQMLGGSVEQCFHAGSFALLNVMGLVCDPVAGLVEYPCAFRNSSGVINAMLCADMALAGVKSVVPFEEVMKAANIVGSALPLSLRETGIGGIAGTETACNIRNVYFSKFDK
ncbi:L-serine dehydratase, iron-sulfur-dependent, alpha subunit [Peptoanaerobacter stomatis]|uniref:L-serine dehydratase n=1 Tax=Peptoanaerobacter stomatis TaxID=796937 RepID=J6HMC0_9FIRM|nr:L-serine ammonia-lyase, iron-sulfur-dependent, subunit alpha [Peptoanaerobacter stomatis]EJU23573.1 L-serine dehydratase, iron-sulfur-dependent, alpha subunit [Peptoanaerobacter stomatis]NWO24506.1 L-serine ammonia-lyase, iron-sulfur-dependent, subunit alpha [Peptostreptococcaceae bacterium oral taxon 081]